MESSDEEPELGGLSTRSWHTKQSAGSSQCPKRERYLTHRESVGSPHSRLPALDPTGNGKGAACGSRRPFLTYPRCGRERVRSRAQAILWRDQGTCAILHRAHASETVYRSWDIGSENRDFLTETMHRRASQRAVSTRHWIGNDQGGALRRHGYPRHHLQKIQSKR